MDVASSNATIHETNALKLRWSRTPSTYMGAPATQPPSIRILSSRLCCRIQSLQAIPQNYRLEVKISNARHRLNVVLEPFTCRCLAPNGIDRNQPCRGVPRAHIDGWSCQKVCRSVSSWRSMNKAARSFNIYTCSVASYISK